MTPQNKIGVSPCFFTNSARVICPPPVRYIMAGLCMADPLMSKTSILCSRIKASRSDFMKVSFMEEWESKFGLLLDTEDRIQQGIVLLGQHGARVEHDGIFFHPCDYGRGTAAQPR